MNEQRQQQYTRWYERQLAAEQPSPQPQKKNNNDQPAEVQKPAEPAA